MTSLLFTLMSKVFVVDTLLTPQRLHVTCPSCFSEILREKNQLARKSQGFFTGARGRSEAKPVSWYEGVRV
jgi:hypothetical protein